MNVAFTETDSMKDERPELLNVGEVFEIKWFMERTRQSLQ